MDVAKLRAALAAAEAVAEAERIAQAAVAAAAAHAVADAATKLPDDPLVQGPAAVVLAAVLFALVVWMVLKCTGYAWRAAKFAGGVLLTLLVVRVVQIVWVPWLTLDFFAHTLVHAGAILRIFGKMFSSVNIEALGTLGQAFGAGGDAAVDAAAQ